MFYASRVEPKVISIEPHITTVDGRIAKRIGGVDEALAVTVSGDDYRAARDCKMQASKKTGSSYNNGLGNTVDDEKHVERTGRIGEMALSSITGCPVDLTYRECGDNMDFETDGVTYDIKTASGLKPYRLGLIMVRNPEGFEMPLKCDIYIVAYVAKEDREAMTADVVIVGYQTKEWLLANCKEVPGMLNSLHMNFELPYSELLPARDLLEMMRSE